MPDDDGNSAHTDEKDALIKELAKGLEDAEKDIRSLMSQLATVLKEAEKVSGANGSAQPPG